MGAAEALGREIDDDERAVVVSERPAASTMYLGLDGTGVPVRKEAVEGRAGKQPGDGTAKTHEVKLVTVWTAETRNKEGRPMRDPGSVTYSAVIASAASRDTDREPSVFAQHTRREVERSCFVQAERCVVLGDGAPWIWEPADEMLPGALQIVDLFHAKEHLPDVSKALHGAVKECAEAWTQARWDELAEGRLDDLLAALRLHAGHCEEARKCGEYLDRNRNRMQYKAFRASGLCVGSGVVEAGCKITVGTRMKRAGMHWTIAGTNAILALRCCYLSGRFEDFWERRSANTQQRSK